jgi:hypothetical protein
MTISAESFVGSLSALIASICAQVWAAFAVGLPSEDESQPACDREPSNEGEEMPRAIRSMDDYAGYLTSNGLGSLDIGGGSSRWGE